MSLAHAAPVVCQTPTRAGTSAGEKRSPIGTNLNGLSYWSSQLPFADSFKTAGSWVSSTRQVWDDKQPVDLDARGWVRSLKPGQIVTAVLFGGDLAKLPGVLAPRYIVEYEGKGTLEYDERAALVSRGEGRDLIRIDPGPGNATVTLVSTDPADYLRNIRVFAEGTKGGVDIFNPLFVARLEGYRALRFGLWQLGESAEDLAKRTWSWSQRAVPEDARWWPKGAPVEIMVALANRTGADPWFCMPHSADDEYVRGFAQLVRRTLDPGRKVFLEYSNEVWNDAFPSTDHARGRGLALGLSQDPHEATLRFYAKRAVEMFAIFERELGRGRIVRVLAFQSDTDPKHGAEVALSFADTRKHVDALSIGPYFGTELAADATAVARTRAMSLDQLFRELETSSLPRAREQMLANAAVARRYGLPLIAYEGGQHLWNLTGQDDPKLDALFHAANRDPRIGVIYSRYLGDWAACGGGLFVHELDCGYFPDAGNWGALEHMAQPRGEAPKFDALQDWMGR